jgi:hypothetical protein
VPLVGRNSPEAFVYRRATHRTDGGLVHCSDAFALDEDRLDGHRFAFLDARATVFRRRFRSRTFHGHRFVGDIW